MFKIKNLSIVSLSIVGFGLQAADDGRAGSILAERLESLIYTAIEKLPANPDSGIRHIKLADQVDDRAADILHEFSPKAGLYLQTTLGSPVAVYGPDYYVLLKRIERCACNEAANPLAALISQLGVDGVSLKLHSTMSLSDSHGQRYPTGYIYQVTDLPKESDHK